MALVGTINVRMDGALKEHGMQVLDRNDVSVSDAIRALFEHLESEQALPEWMIDESGGGVARKRADLRSVVGKLRALPGRSPEGDPRQEYRRHLVEKHCFEGVRE